MTDAEISAIWQTAPLMALWPFFAMAATFCVACAVSDAVCSKFVMLSAIDWMSPSERVTASPVSLDEPATFVMDVATCCVACADWFAFSVSCAAYDCTFSAVRWMS